MRFFIGLILTLTTLTTAFARPALAQPSTTGATTSEKNAIDSLNDIASKIYLQNPDSARHVAERALLQAERLKYPAGIGQSFLNIGHVYWAQSYYPIALFYFNKALINLPESKPMLIADCYGIKGRTYADLGNYPEALNNLEQAEQYAGNNTEQLATVYCERSFVYKRLKNYEQAIKEAKQALALDKTTKQHANTAILYGRLSGIYTLTKQYAAALAYSDTAYKMSISNHNNRLRATTYVEYAGIYNHLRNLDKAIDYAKKGAALADSIGVVDALTSAYRVLISSYQQNNDLKGAMAAQKAYDGILDNLNIFEKKKNTELMQDYFALNTRLNEIEWAERNSIAIKAKMQEQRATIITLALSLLVVLAMLSITYYYYKQKKILGNKLHKQNEALLKQKQLIEAQTANLETVSKVKDKLLAVIGHDLRTPLSNLRNIAEMFELGYLTINELQMLMKDVGPLVKGAELTLSNLMDWAGNHIRGRSLNSSRLDIFLLGVEMEQTFNHALQRKSIEFLNQASPGQSVSADENHIKVVLRNLISNAIKFTDVNGRIKLHSVYDEHNVIICVEDNGKGMSEDEIGRLFFLQTHFTQPGTLGENGTGIGLLLCKELIELNGGKLWIVSTPGKGSQFFFSLPLNTEYA